jgi:hypothetical protein
MEALVALSGLQLAKSLALKALKSCKACAKLVHSLEKERRAHDLARVARRTYGLELNQGAGKPGSVNLTMVRGVRWFFNS